VLCSSQNEFTQYLGTTPMYSSEARRMEFLQGLQADAGQRFAKFTEYEREQVGPP
jgi:hypothetical protein